MSADQELLVPPRRLGALLRQARTDAGVELSELARRSGRLTPVELHDLEQGRSRPSDDVLRHVVALYGLDDDTLVPARSRLVIDLDEGRIAVADTGVAVDTMSDADTVLARYLALVYQLRDLPVGTPLGLRELDVEVLATALSLRDGDVDTRLQSLIAEQTVVARHQRPLRRRLLLPVAGVVVAATAAGVLLIVRDETPSSTVDPAGPPASAGPSVPGIDIGGAAVVDGPALPTTSIGGPAIADAPDTEIIDAVVLDVDGAQEPRRD